MLDLGVIAFAQPALLFALLALPALWLLLRLTPPAPKRQLFPALRLLLGLQPREETPARTPWWILLLRLAIAGCLILAAAQPLLNPTARLGGSGPLVLLIDNGWSAAPLWQEKQTAWGALLDQAERQKRPVIVAATAPARDGAQPAFSDLLSAEQARERLSTLTPQPWPPARGALVTAARNLSLEGSAQVVWLSDGVAQPADRELAATLQRLGALTVLTDPPGNLAKLLEPPERGGSELAVLLRRAEGGLPERSFVDAYAEDGRLLGRAEALFEAEALEATAAFNLPIELRNEAARLSIAGNESAGGVALLDERWRRRPVGLYAADSLEAQRPLIGELFFLDRALAPFTELRYGGIAELLARDLSVLVLADVGRLTPEEQTQIEEWMAGGGLLLRFAGPRLAAAVPPPGSQETPLLLPVDLRQGDRSLGGSLSWDQASGLSPFAPSSPFSGLAIPEDVLVERQVLAEPSIDLANRTWARLKDGTPLVTASPVGEGWNVLFHTSANRDWGTLPISGLFVDMLRRLVDLSEGVSGNAEGVEALPPAQLLDGFGRLTSPWPEAADLPLTEVAPLLPGPQTPPGIYGDRQERRAFNLGPLIEELAPLGEMPGGVTVSGYQGDRERDLTAWLLAAALLLASVDLLLALWLRGLLRGLRPATAALALACLLPFSAQAQNLPPDDPELFALQATSETRLAYVLTGVPSVDRVTHAGIMGLSEILALRTSIEAAEPFGVTPGRDELAFFPLLYWPVTPEQNPLDSLAQQAVSEYLRNGGTIVFDLREEQATRGLSNLASPAEAALRRITSGLDMPPLAPVGPDHVLTKAFYLLQDFPGRFTDGPLWVETVGEDQNDGVASVIVTANDWASAWAIDEAGRPLFPLVGGKTQREMSFRVGVNLVMYAMTGNYKADQVHIPFILERLGQ
ncbi:DUF4159 domain-containing protein [Limibacillus halophilus]